MSYANRLFGVLLLMASSALYALPKVTEGQIVRIEQFKSEFVPSRNIDIWLPSGYSEQTKYAVLYMHDGQMLFDAEQTWNKQSWQVAATAQRLQNEKKVVPFIVVGIHNGGAHRHSEYFPEDALKYLSTPQLTQLYAAKRGDNPLFSGEIYSNQYLKFLVSELKPYIDTHYSTLTDAKNTAIMGSSMGGLISWYGLVKYPNVFGKMAALSTHWPGTFSLEDNPVPDAFRQLLVESLPENPKHKLYFDYGNKTLDALYPALQQKVDQTLIEKGYVSPWRETHFFDGAEHSEQAWSNRLSIPLVFLFSTE